jgi:hypothetical protein
MSEEAIRGCYRYILGREPNPQEVALWLDKPAMTPAALRAGFLQSGEFRDALARLGATPWAPPGGQVAVFLHIPKTAGSSLIALLRAAYAGKPALFCHDVDLSPLAEMPLQDRNRLALVAGHLTPGVANQLHQRVLYFTALRTPVDRVYSFYRFVRRSTSHPEHLLARDSSFGQFLELSLSHPHLRPALDNGQVRWLAGCMTPAAFTATPALFRQAVQRLFAPDMLFGLTEHFDDFLALLVAEGIIPQARPMRENAAPPDEPPLAEALAGLTAEQRGLLDAFIGWDNLLYDMARAYVLGEKLSRQQGQG